MLPTISACKSPGQDPTSAMYQACDGVTTSMELEFGAYPVAEFYSSRVSPI
jgi:hypothetical protein